MRPEVGLGFSIFSECARFRIVAAAAAPLVFFTYGYDRGPDDVRATIPTITTATTMAAATWCRLVSDGRRNQKDQKSTEAIS